MLCYIIFILCYVIFNNRAKLAPIWPLELYSSNYRLDLVTFFYLLVVFIRGEG